jgi:MerR family transcriptional regulator, thiopeptide resistance regulator
MPPPQRSGGNYRCYSEADAQQLLQIRAYRNAGLALENIRTILATRSNRRGGDASRVLQRRLLELDAEIDALRTHQHAILQLMGHKALGKAEMITKEKWVSIMKSCGFSDEQMHRWHAEFERSAPEEHQEFLEFLHIPAQEISTIREQSRAKA